MKCNTCNTEFKAHPELPNQAHGCASSLYLREGTYYILASYGSSYDMQRYALRTDKYQIGDICDECIKKYIENGNAQLIEDGVW